MNKHPLAPRINQQAQGPIIIERAPGDPYPVLYTPHSVPVAHCAKGQPLDPVCQVLNGPLPWQGTANARLLAASYTAFDKAGRALGVDAAELAERIDLAALLSNLRTLLAADKDGNPILFRALDTAHKDGAADALIDLHEQMKRLEAVTA